MSFLMNLNSLSSSFEIVFHVFSLCVKKGPKNASSVTMIFQLHWRLKKMKYIRSPSKFLPFPHYRPQPTLQQRDHWKENPFNIIWTRVQGWGKTPVIIWTLCAGMRVGGKRERTDATTGRGRRRAGSEWPTEYLWMKCDGEDRWYYEVLADSGEHEGGLEEESF